MRHFSLLLLALVLSAAAASTAAATPGSAAASTAASTFGERTDRGRPSPVAFDVSATPRSALVMRWPGKRITYHDATRDKDSVRRAVKRWNSSGLGVRFVRVANRRTADVYLRNSRLVQCGEGRATLGRVLRPFHAFVEIRHGRPKDGQACAWPGQTIVMLHELGHVLGLTHDNTRCAIMNSSHVNGVAPYECVDARDYDESKVGRWRCRGLEKVDVRRAVRLYGGRVRPVRKDPWCSLVDPMPGAGAVTLTALDTGTYQLVLHHVDEPALPSFIRGAEPRFVLHVAQGGCASDPEDPATFDQDGTWTVPPGNDQVVDFGYRQPGTSCVSAFVTDLLGEWALAPSHATLVVPELPSG